MRHLLFTLLLLCAVTAHAQTSSVINMGECQLESGAKILDCRIAYTTVGTLNSDRSNAILFPTFYGGKASDLLKYVAPDLLVDSSKYFVIVVDSFGNGVSSSPSNSVSQSGAGFPAITIRDMVSMQKRLLNDRTGACISAAQMPAATFASLFRSKKLSRILMW